MKRRAIAITAAIVLAGAWLMAQMADGPKCAAILEWSASVDTDLRGYNVYLFEGTTSSNVASDYGWLTSTTALTARIVTEADGRALTFAVEAFDEAGHVSDLAIVSGHAMDRLPPDPASNLTLRFVEWEGP